MYVKPVPFGGCPIRGVAILPASALLKLNGELALHPEEKAKVLRQSFPPTECPEEIERAVRRASPNKAPGADGVTNGILHRTLDILPPHTYAGSSIHVYNRDTAPYTSRRRLR